jgi:hypothetical protein
MKQFLVIILSRPGLDKKDGRTVIVARQAKVFSSFDMCA